MLPELFVMLFILRTAQAILRTICVPLGQFDTGASPSDMQERTLVLVLTALTIKQFVGLDPPKPRTMRSPIWYWEAFATGTK
jgi:hypothetical protein